MELIESGLAGMEISMGESDTEPRMKMKSIRKAQSTSLRRIKEFQERIRSRRERLLPDPQPPPPRHEPEEEEEKAAAPTEAHQMELSESELAGVQSYTEYIEIMERKEQQLRRAYEIKDERKGTEEEQEIDDYRKFWERCFGVRFGSFDAETSLGSMYCSTGTIPEDALPESSNQFFSIKVTSLMRGHSWPLQVYGFVAARDSVDRKRNYIFRCTRDSFQTLTRMDPFLRLTGPSRAVLLIDPVAIEVQLKVKGKDESEDQVLAFTCFYVHERSHLEDGIRIRVPRKCCTLEFALEMLLMSVEATVGVRVVAGSWPDQCPGQVVCSTNNVKEGRVVLLDFQNGKLPTKPDGVVELARHVVSVDYPEGNLIVFVEASRDGFSAQGTVDFGMKVSGGSSRMCDLVFCKMEVTVFWSLISCDRI